MILLATDIMQVQMAEPVRVGKDIIFVDAISATVVTDVQSKAKYRAFQ